MSEHVYVADTETTGFKDPVVPIQLAYQRLSGSGVDQYVVVLAGNHRFNPGRPIEFGAMATHGITPDQVEREQPWEGWQWDATPEYLIGHSIEYDYKNIRPALGNKPQPKLICTNAIARVAYPDIDSHKLGAIVHYAMFNSIGDMAKRTVRTEVKKLLKNAHEAQADVSMSLWVLKVCAAKLKIYGWQQLHELSELALMPSIMPFGKYRDEKIRDIPGDYKAWALSPRGMTDLDPRMKKAMGMTQAEWDQHEAAIADLCAEK